MIRALLALILLAFSGSAHAAGVGAAVNSDLGCTNSGDTYQWNGSAMVCTPSSGSGTVTSIVAGTGLTGGTITTYWHDRA
jgi:hypothetical protein